MEDKTKKQPNISELARRLAKDASVVSEPTDFTTLRKIYKEAREAGYSPAHTHGIDPLRR